jgi:hypothetical protein
MDPADHIFEYSRQQILTVCHERIPPIVPGVGRHQFLSIFFGRAIRATTGCGRFRDYVRHSRTSTRSSWATAKSSESDPVAGQVAARTGHPPRRLPASLPQSRRARVRIELPACLQLEEFSRLRHSCCPTGRGDQRDQLGLFDGLKRQAGCHDSPGDAGAMIGLLALPHPAAGQTGPAPAPRLPRANPSCQSQNLPLSFLLGRKSAQPCGE